MRRLPLLLLLPFLLTAADSVPTWQRSYFYDRAQHNFNIADLACPSQKLCIAVGTVEQSSGNPHPYAVITRDGGAHWTPQKPGDYPVSLFFLNDATGWMVTTRGLWATEDGAQTWKRIAYGKGWLRVFFTGPRRGWLVGAKRLFAQTSDGGTHWTIVPDAAKMATLPADFIFEYAHFSDPLHGIVVGEVAGRAQTNVPDWMDPGMARFQQPIGGGVFVGGTVDGGGTWTWGPAGVRRGLITAAFPADRHWLVFGPVSPTEVYSEVVDRDWPTGKSTSLYRLDGARISDLDATPDGHLVLAAIQVPGKFADIPVPGKVRMFGGADFTTLHEESVDYRAVARNITLASTPSEWFAATDTGMILRRKR